MESLCSICDVCRFMPKQRHQRTLVGRGEGARVLVLDDMQMPINLGRDMAFMILDSVPFDYAHSIRCVHDDGDLTPEQKQEALGRCSVWTRNLIGNYAIYLCTKNALNQIGIGAERNPGDVFANPRLGLVLCINPLASITPSEMAEYTSKVNRLFKKAGIK